MLMFTIEDVFSLKFMFVVSFTIIALQLLLIFLFGSAFDFWVFVTFVLFVSYHLLKALYVLGFLE